MRVASEFRAAGNHIHKNILLVFLFRASECVQEKWPLTNPLQFLCGILGLPGRLSKAGFTELQLHTQWICPGSWITVHWLMLMWANQSWSCFPLSKIFGREMWISVVLSPMSTWPIASCSERCQKSKSLPFSQKQTNKQKAPTPNKIIQKKKNKTELGKT